MSNDKSDPAFPHVHDIQSEPGMARSIRVEPGMTLRDYLAAKALGGMLATFHDDDAREMMLQNAIEAKRTPKQQVAFAAYEYADAMLAERAA